MALLLDGNNIPVGQIANTIAAGGGTAATLTPPDQNNELMRGLAYMLDTYAPLSKVQEVWGRPIRETLAVMGEREHANVTELRPLSYQLADELEAEAVGVMSTTGQSRHIIDRRYDENEMGQPDLSDMIEHTLTSLDAVAASQQYAIEKHEQDAVLAHKMMATGVRTFADAGVGAVNQLGSAVRTSQQVQSIANAGRSYSATAARAVVQEEQAKAQGRDELVGYAAAATGASISDYL